MLVTHQLQYLPAADEVLVLREGRIAERGTYAALVARGVDFHQFEHRPEGEEGSAAALEGAPSLSDGGEDDLPSPSGADGAAGARAGLLDASGGASDAAVRLSGGRGEDDSAEEQEGGGQSTPAAAAAQQQGLGRTRDSAIELQSQGPAAAAAAAAAFVDVPLLDGGATAATAAGGQPNGTAGEGQADDEGQFKPKPPPIMAPTRMNLAAGPLPASGGGGGDDKPGKAGSSGRLTKAEERAVGQVDRAVYAAYFRCGEGSD